MTDQERISALEKKLEGSRKDGWDKISALGGLLIPVAIFGVGLVYSNQSAAANEEIARQTAATNAEIARINAGVQQAQFLLQAVSPLAGADDRQKRLLAIQAVRIALREQGRQIIDAVSRTEPDLQVRTAAVRVIVNPAIQQLYSADPRQRIGAYNELLRTRAGDPALPPLLMEAARNSLNGPDAARRNNGIYNTLVLLSHLNPAALEPHGQALRGFADQVRPVGPRVAQRADVLIGRLP